MGCELGDWEEWHHERSVPWHLLDDESHRGLQRWIAHLNRLVTDWPALHELDREPAGFTWIDADDAEHSTFSFMRADRRGDVVVVVFNATPTPRPGCTVAVPRSGEWELLANSDAVAFGGSGYGARGREAGSGDRVCAVGGSAGGSGPATLELDLPPLALLVLAPVGGR
jgi:1,4-alpha-glucan branching enzyme